MEVDLLSEIIDVIYNEYFDKDMALTITKEKVEKLQHENVNVDVSLNRFEENNKIGYGVLLTVRDIP